MYLLFPKLTHNADRQMLNDHACWCFGNTGSQDINSYDIAKIFTEIILWLCSFCQIFIAGYISCHFDNLWFTLWWRVNQNAIISFSVFAHLKICMQHCNNKNAQITIQELIFRAVNVRVNKHKQQVTTNAICLVNTRWMLSSFQADI